MSNVSEQLSRTVVFHGGTVGAFEGSVAPIPQLGGRTIGVVDEGGGSSAARSCVPPTEFEEPPPVEETGEQEFFLPFAVTDKIQELFFAGAG